MFNLIEIFSFIITIGKWDPFALERVGRLLLQRCIDAQDELCLVKFNCFAWTYEVETWEMAC